MNSNMDSLPGFAWGLGTQEEQWEELLAQDSPCQELEPRLLQL